MEETKQPKGREKKATDGGGGESRYRKGICQKRTFFSGLFFFFFVVVGCVPVVVCTCLFVIKGASRALLAFSFSLPVCVCVLVCCCRCFAMNHLSYFDAKAVKNRDE